ncbi:MAG TPA: haloacid dehalogenase type II [Acidiphilium sp.]|jgi:2-haloacid dehalogenase|uniref:haloacid dehalogenase type II n=1 Tax=Acidiphilium sp. 34-64-41 TaxID=1970297 RepID=UPI000BCD2EDB|nr:haloacid dehalogenase type II [Acidiphilium sp. 34-64-41]OYV62897.1 MAG: haloacid dehalogenase, type II [Acidiphilium sp. 21-62-4]OZB24128.1 MAG: haloacid dehalogenase, type II [Acidiphilium sp. 34-64-41]HQT89647.1 haloacid dehalogenase type II [Acidiphilium sp.]
MSGLAGIKACVFDAYGTLFNFNSAVARCAAIPELKRAVLATTWRDKQIQYTLLRSLQHRYADFEQVTAEALDYALDSTGLTNAGHRMQLLDLYQTVSVYPEVPPILKALKAAGIVTAILSNGTSAMLKAAIDHAAIGAQLDHVLSVETVGVFKPAPEVYQLAVDRLGVAREAICFVSSNGWDAYGAAVFGFQVAWCNRADQPVERLPGQPAIVVRTLSELAFLWAPGR